MSEGLSVLIPTRNEEANISSCIESLGDIADEIVVLDNLSSDKTVEIAHSMNAVIHQRPFDNYADNKNAALDLLKYPWVFILDADERMTPELRTEIKTLLKSEPAADAFSVRRETFFRDRRVRCWSGGRVVRLFRRQKARYDPETPVHEHLIVNGTTGNLQGHLEHYTFRSYRQYLPKMISFALLSAESDFRKGKRTYRTLIVTLPVFRFLKTYLLRGGILDGVPGILISWLSAYSIYLKHARLWELQNSSPTNEKMEI